MAHTVCQGVGGRRTLRAQAKDLFFANDIGHSEQLLSRAKEIYAALEARIDHRESMAATYFFLGLIAKVWVAEHRPVQDSLRDAKLNLEKAGDFVVRVTLAEIESYSEATHPISASTTITPAHRTPTRSRIAGTATADNC